ncbi:outer membrane autotransporter protein [Neorhizobium galegae]|uniref:autotransporter outer membrane beta-barrel domain-containing protein n=1 Tax=Neorhizobium galegae TaxID=399 RepID=UPI001AE0F466|nr:autotransporter domain-containing protein [Neorhizobium galegae]MBP2551631.1 outer membrane autotransporter protein [Neorhizobium galegae]
MLSQVSGFSRRAAPGGCIPYCRVFLLRSCAIIPVLTASLIIGSGARPARAQEPWTLVERTFFSGSDADAARGQGVTTDGTNWYFSGTHSLEIANQDFSRVRIDTDAIAANLKIPSQYSDIGLNHIGDIDYANGLLYISLDSSNRDPVTGNKYSNPVVAVYNAADLSFTGNAYVLDPSHGIHDIASWVAVDAKAGFAYGMAYDNATEMAVYNLADFSFVKYITLSQTIDQAQGGKLLDGWMYFATDGDGKTLYRANLETGKVEIIGNLKIDGEQEVEGLSMRWTDHGWSMNVLNREESFPGSGAEGVGFYTYLRPWGNALSGEIHSDITAGLIDDTRLLRDATNNRLIAALAHEQGMALAASGPAEQHASLDPDAASFWTDGIHARSSVDGSGYVADADHNSTGLIAGVDIPVSGWRLGVMGSYSQSDFSVANRFSTAETDNYQFGAFAGTQVDSVGLRFGASYGRHDISTRRDVVFPAFSETLTADYDAATSQAYGEIDYRFLERQVEFRPFAGMHYVRVKTDGFSEKGGTTAALSSDGSTDSNLFSTVGLRINSKIEAASSPTFVHAMIGWQHAMRNVTPETTFTMTSGASFSSPGVPIAKDALAVDLGMEVALSDQSALRASYSGQFADNSRDHAFKVGLDVRF